MTTGVTDLRRAKAKAFAHALRTLKRVRAREALTVGAWPSVIV